MHPVQFSHHSSHRRTRNTSLFGHNSSYASENHVAHSGGPFGGTIYSVRKILQIYIFAQKFVISSIFDCFQHQTSLTVRNNSWKIPHDHGFFGLSMYVLKHGNRG